MSTAAGATTLATRRSSRLVTWVRAWRAGLVPYDEVAEEVARDEEHLVADAPGAWTDVSLREGLTAFSKLTPDQVRLVLPAPGDPRGLPGPGEFTGAALVAGEAVIAGDLGLIPEVRTHTSGSGMTFETVLWRCFALPAGAPPPVPVSVAEAETELNQLLAEATNTLARLDIAQWRPELAGALAAIRKPDSANELPPGFDPRSRRLFARASVLDRVLALADEVAPGGAVNGFEVQARDAALRPLASACRGALVAACNAPLI
ncbi:hypothetical protein Ais01nite_57730 [Asanoa ishikariensis]|uniref:Uncharacterized protein n=1 Tax=Asanoa ishikariensis TaxID=137265 RepID=A0A1H3TZG6_9ACTN|nr:hypothetical protein [Asanoa ishikariensis]GIF67738.1 hypothetical protein Ais01nite_57730 [Asanoa ishikariensis]SDZ55482.1 hypothetical protein SAMN05421684_6635 [Asanoa ishikariensis]